MTTRPAAYRTRVFAALLPALTLGQGLRAVGRSARAGIAAVLILALTACSSTTFFYNRLDFILPWYLGRYVDLDREQDDWLDTSLESYLAWHRREELPSYDRLLDELEQDLDAPVSLELFQERAKQLEYAWYRTRDNGLDLMLELGARLRDDQIDEFIEALRKQQRKFERKYLERSEAEFREDARENLREMLEDYFGRLSPEQRERVDYTASMLARSDSTWLGERAAWIDTMEGLLERKPGWQDEIRRTIEEWEAELDEETLELYDGNTLLVQELIVDIVNSRSERQDRRLRRRIAGYRDDIATLIAQAE